MGVRGIELRGAILRILQKEYSCVADLLLLHFRWLRQVHLAVFTPRLQDRKGLRCGKPIRKQLCPSFSLLARSDFCGLTFTRETGHRERALQAGRRRWDARARRGRRSRWLR